MKTVGDILEPFSVEAAKPGFTEAVNEKGESAFITITEKSFPGQWKVYYFYPKDFTPICNSEIKKFNELHEEFDKRNAVIIGGSSDNEFSKLALRRENSFLNPFSHYSFGDPAGDLIDQIGIRDKKAKVAMRTTMIVDPDNVIQHISVLPLKCGRSIQEVVRLLDAIQSGEMALCERSISQK